MGKRKCISKSFYLELLGEATEGESFEEKTITFYICFEEIGIVAAILLFIVTVLYMHSVRGRAVLNDVSVGYVFWKDVKGISTSWKSRKQVRLETAGKPPCKSSEVPSTMCDFLAMILISGRAYHSF